MLKFVTVQQVKASHSARLSITFYAKIFFSFGFSLYK